MILNRDEFSLWIREYDDYVPTRHTWESFMNSQKPIKPKMGMREQLKVEVPIDDIMIREMLDNTSHSLLYHNIEFRKALRKRLIFYKNVNSNL